MSSELNHATLCFDDLDNVTGGVGKHAAEEGGERVAKTLFKAAAKRAPFIGLGITAGCIAYEVKKARDEGKSWGDTIKAGFWGIF